MTPSTEAVKAAMEKAGYHASVSAVMAILQAAYDVDFEALRAENVRLIEERESLSKSFLDFAGEQGKDYAVLKSENARLREALKPFAECDVWDGYKDDETFVSGLKIGDLRAARAAMGESDE